MMGLMMMMMGLVCGMCYFSEKVELRTSIFIEDLRKVLEL